MNKSIDNDEYFNKWAEFLLKNSGEAYSLQSCDIALIGATELQIERVTKLRTAIIKKVQKRLN